ncbi:uncharacterized protein RCC_10126 [Ramularia collo-cygni]|uniref:2',3'-cyclic-nucleotide 3'-phosphodiesterase n=1 Tax=Ramularia collo-cygni TaxID=112498 RepID=A0A2D3VJ57_9PEZI|nr:uncharacterized protein RCC_10126 [Ramularia collo-cygni]CZT24401.1 uncharacterized protein RCC_10126 [Ramularia collo-cygni]
MSLALWFLPRQSSPFTKTAQELISETIPNIFLSPTQQIQEFPPHVTITSGITLPDSQQTPQDWLDALDCSPYAAEKNEIILELQTLQTEDPFFRKCNIALTENSNLHTFAEKCRVAAGLKPREKGEYRPHFSLFYGDVATKDVEAKLPLIEMKVGFAIGDLFACCGGALCLGGEMVLVDTSRPITAWCEAVVAKREVPFVMWRASKHLA